MNDIILDEYDASLKAMKTTDLRKIARTAGVKVVGLDTPVNKGRKADLIFSLVELKGQELAENTATPATPAARADDSTLKIRTARRFIAEAEKKDWTVEIDNKMATEQGDIVIVKATKGDESITLRWIDGAYDYYQGGSFHTDPAGKARKILNVSAAIARHL